MTYTKPQLQRYGSFRELTLVGTTGSDDTIYVNGIGADGDGGKNYSCSGSPLTCVVIS